MEDYRLEQQKNAAAQLLLRPPLLSLYAYRQSLPPAVARFRLQQVISQNPTEADPTVTSTAEQLLSEQPTAQPPAANGARPEPQPAQQQPAAEPEQGPQPPWVIPEAIDEDANVGHFYSSSSDLDSDVPSDLDSEEFDRLIDLTAQRALRHWRRQFHRRQQQQQQQQPPPPPNPQVRRGEERRLLRLEDLLREQEEEQEPVRVPIQVGFQVRNIEQQQQVQGQGQVAAVAAAAVGVEVRGELRRQLAWVAADDEVLPEAE